jgi:hypothetical protein
VMLLRIRSANAPLVVAPADPMRRLAAGPSNGPVTYSGVSSKTGIVRPARSR